MHDTCSVHDSTCHAFKKCTVYVNALMSMWYLAQYKAVRRDPNANSRVP